MPEMGGLEATEIILRDIPHDQQPVIIALTANAFLEDKKRYLLAGMDEVVTKPIQKMELNKLLNDYSEKIRAKRKQTGNEEGHRI